MRELRETQRETETEKDRLTDRDTYTISGLFSTT